MVGNQKVKEEKTTILNEDGTKEVIEKTEDENGVHEKKYRLGKNNEQLAIE